MRALKESVINLSAGMQNDKHNSLSDDLGQRWSKYWPSATEQA